MRNHNIASLLFLGLLSVAIAGCTAQPERPAEVEEPVAEEAPEAVEPAPEPVKPKVEIKRDVPLRYTVKKGDTLWSIARKFLKDPWQWPEVWFVNPKVKNPHRIYPGDTIELIFKDGRPILARADDASALRDGKPPVNTVRLSPSVRDGGSTQQIPAIPIDVIRNYLTGPRLVTLDEIDRSPYLIDFAEKNVLGAPGMTAYVGGISGEPVEQYEVVRLGEAYRDPDDDSVIGQEALPVSQAKLTRSAEGERPAEVVLTQPLRETSRGDRLLSVDDQQYGAAFFPHAPANAVNGRIISVYNGLSQIGQYQVVTLNRGSNHGLEQGHVLHIFQTGRVTEDPVLKTDVTLPDQNAGTLMVFKVTPRLSYALVMSATRAVHVLDRVEKPE